MNIEYTHTHVHGNQYTHAIGRPKSMQHFARLSMRIFINYASDLIKNLTSCRLERRSTEQGDRLLATRRRRT